MANGEAAAGKANEIVEISGGRSVVVQEWSWAKLPELLQYVGKWEKTGILVEQSVRPEDREKLVGLGNKDLAKLAEAVYRLNVDADLLKNLTALAGKIQQIGEGLGPATP